MTEVKRVHFAIQPSARHQPRGAVGVRIGDVLIVTTHLDDVTDSSAIRQEQVRTILREWDGEKVAIIAGDMNAEPADLEMGLFSEAGYGDLAEPAGPTTTMDDPPKRIDYIWAIEPAHGHGPRGLGPPRGRGQRDEGVAAMIGRRR
jgi:endonuclease/exonuclease/phosphatase family metal-dependent hydrolase